MNSIRTNKLLFLYCYSSKRVRVWKMLYYLQDDGWYRLFYFFVFVGKPYAAMLLFVTSRYSYEKDEFNIVKLNGIH